MEFRQLKYFVQVARELHFGRAAATLDITQPALSKQIRVLESELGVELLRRSKRKVELTKAGEVFLVAAQQILRQAKQAVRLAQDTAAGKVGQLNIGFTVTATYTILPELMNRFRLSYPQVEVQMLELSTETQVTALNKGEIDLGFLHPPIDTRGFNLHPIMSEEFVAVLPKSHFLAAQESLHISDLASESFILHSRSEGPYLYDEFHKICRKKGFEPRIIKEVDSHQGRIFMVAAGMGITFLPQGLQASVAPDLVCKPINDLLLMLDFSAAWRSMNISPVLEQFLKLLLNKIEI